MKRFLSVLLASAVIGFAAMPADAALIDRGGGLIYDDDLNITWLADANYAMTSGYHATGQMLWADAVAWADGLSYYDTIRGVTYDDWRLPVTVQPDSSCSGQYDPGGGLPVQGSRYNCTGSEMGHLYYTELGNVAGGPLANTGDFQNLLPILYWSGTEYAPNLSEAWAFYFDIGYQVAAGGATHALAVRDGDVTGGAPAVPEPSTMLLLGGGIAGLALARRRFRK